MTLKFYNPTPEHNSLFAVASDVSDFELKLQLLTTAITPPATRVITHDSAASTALTDFMGAAQTTLERLESWNATVPLETTTPEHTMLLSAAIDDLQIKTEAYMNAGPHGGAYLQCADAMAGFSHKCHTIRERLAEMHYPEPRQRTHSATGGDEADLRQRGAKLFADLAGKPRVTGDDDTDPTRPGGGRRPGRAG